MRLIKCFSQILLFLFLSMTISQGAFAQVERLYEAEEIAAGKKTAMIIERRYGLNKDKALQQKVSAIGNRLAKFSSKPDLPYSFKVLNSRQVNAIACPGGFIYLHKGLIDKMSSDDELVGAIAHELAHIALNHTMNTLEKKNKEYYHQEEFEADAEGFKMAYRAGYNPYGIFVTISKLNKAGKNSKHPQPEERIVRLSLIAKEAGIEPLVKKTAENGVFVFLHEDSRQILISNGFAGYTSEQRGWLLAGRIFLLKQVVEEKIDKNKLNIRVDNAESVLFYGDTYLYKLSAKEMEKENLSVLKQDIFAFLKDYKY